MVSHLALTGPSSWTYGPARELLAPSTTIPRELRPVAAAGATGLSVGVTATGVAYAAYVADGRPDAGRRRHHSALGARRRRPARAPRAAASGARQRLDRARLRGRVRARDVLLTVAEVLQAIYDDFGGVAF
jgi:hypothetical protein